MNFKQILNHVQAKPEQEILPSIMEYMGIQIPELLLAEFPCKFSSSVAFCYCTSFDFNVQLSAFSFLINLIAATYDLCYEPGNVIPLGCSCNCGTKTVVFHFTLALKECTL